MDQSARDILMMNDRGGYTVPRDGLYPFQWNWDSCFVAEGWMTFDEPRAWTELDMLFAGQWADGMVPHIIFHQDADSYFPGPDVWQVEHQPRTSGITQPPVAGSSLRRMYDAATERPLADAKLRELFPKVLAFNRWFHTARDPEGTGLVAIYHPWESGRDNSADWDKPLERVSLTNLEAYTRKDLDHIDSDQRPDQIHYDRYVALVQLFRQHNYDPAKLYEVSPVRVADAGINAILLRADRDMLYLAEKLGDEDAIAELKGWIARAEDAYPRLWNDKEGAFCSYDLVMKEHVRGVSSSAFLCFYADAGTPEQRQKCADTLYFISEEVEFLAPSLSPKDSRFDPKRYWRGPVWPVINYMIAMGLNEQGEEELGKRVNTDTARLIYSGGFMEYFNPVSGEGLGGDTFTWTAAMWLVTGRHSLPSLRGQGANIG